MQKVVPNHPVWKHEVFSDPLYTNFKRELEAAANAEADQEQLVMQRLIPVIERQLANINDHQHANYEQLIEIVKNLTLQVSDISTGRAPLQINLNWPQGSNTPTVSTSSSSSVLNQSSINTAATPTAITGNTPTTASSTSHLVQYRLSRGLTTFTDLWKEWTEGLGGNHSVGYYGANCPNWYLKDKTFYITKEEAYENKQSLC
ncbi:hypothetical protein MAM1_0142c06448 [Mucor ambiguus]|uniref:Uncharacterized protein n=1 Tax=Mucor ambiguus TaxID=91626 RepID=A0A0C9MXN3_9FUNG|nr:hypothetical protein MAM1_0142c06448 [Mucor ambiguus]